MIETDDGDLCVFPSAFYAHRSSNDTQDDTFDDPFDDTFPARKAFTKKRTSLMRCDDYQFSNRVTEKVLELCSEYQINGRRLVLTFLCGSRNPVFGDVWHINLDAQFADRPTDRPAIVSAAAKASPVRYRMVRYLHTAFQTL